MTQRSADKLPLAAAGSPPSSRISAPWVIGLVFAGIVLQALPLRASEAPVADTTGVIDGTASTDDDLVAALEALDDSLDAAFVWRPRLRETDRPVFNELVGAALEMYGFGDIEAAKLLVADALDFARERAP